MRSRTCIVFIAGGSFHQFESHFGVILDAERQLVGDPTFPVVVLRRATWTAHRRTNDPSEADPF